MKSGRTNDLARRKDELARDKRYKGLDFEGVYRTDKYSEQRGLAQRLHEKYKPPLDKIRDIDPNNPRMQEYMKAAEDYLRRLRGKRGGR